MAGHALEEKDSVCLVQDGVRGTAGVAEHVPGIESTNLRNKDFLTTLWQIILITAGGF